jgi:dTDP-4-amino-4,6-dideoxygalactose transaminase
VDIDPRTYNLDATRLEAAITERTKAIIPVHLYGQPSNMPAIKAVADRYSVPIIEDAAQAHGGRYGGERVGSWGAMTGFSFYPGKNLGAYGDAGAIITNDDALAARLRLLREHGSKTKYEHAIVGMNSRLDGLQAAILKVKLSHLSAWTEARRERAKRYGELLATIPGLILPWEDPNAHHVYHLYVVQVPVDRDALLSVLQRRGVGAGIHYPTPLHLQPALAEYGGRVGDYPIAESVARRIISLPLYPELRDDQMQFICEMLGEALLALASGVR